MRWPLRGRYFEWLGNTFRGCRSRAIDFPSTMTAEELSHSAKNDQNPPPDLPAVAEALWYARAGNWDAAHDLCQKVPGASGAWIHAWLHREEGDIGNAGYWYARADRKMPAAGTTLEEEWVAMAKELIG